MKYNVRIVDTIIHIIYTISMILDRTLEQYGLTKKEAKVYLAVLELGQGSVLDITKKTELKRPTIYVTLESLTQQGFVNRIPKGTTTLFSAQDPSLFLSTLEDKQTKIKAILPLLKALHNSSKSKPSIKYYEGKDNVRKLYDDLFKAKQYLFFYGSLKDVFKVLPEIEEVVTPEKILKLNIPVKEILASGPVDKRYAKRARTVRNSKYMIKMLKKGEAFAIDSFIYDDTVVIISVKGNCFGVVIESKDIADSFKILYELAWQSAQLI